MFIRKSKYNAMQNEILRLTRINEAWAVQHKSALDELRKAQEKEKEVRHEVFVLAEKSEKLQCDFACQSEELQDARAEIASLKLQNNELARALHRASHGGHRHGN